MKTRNAQDENEHLKKLLIFENECYTQGASYIAGVDEVGRGPLAGPVLACAVILPKMILIEGIDDSKKLSAKKRENLAKIIKESALAVSIGMADVRTIDNINIYQATVQAMTDAVNGLKVIPDVILIDAMKLPAVSTAQRAIIKGDSLSMSIAAASIVAKVTRDKMMDAYHEIYPVYGFDRHKGYGTEKHIEAIRQYGLCPIHRRSFAAKFAGVDY